jgi:hypothetical protein
MALWETSLRLLKNYAVCFECINLNTLGRGRFDPVEPCAQRIDKGAATELNPAWSA